MKRLIYIAEPKDETHCEWFVLAHNLDEAGDVEEVAGPFVTEAEANVEAQRLQKAAR